MSPLAATVAFVFGLVALGYFSGWSGLLKQETDTALTEFAVSVAVPLLLFRTMSQADFAGSLPLGLWAVYFSAIVVTWGLSQLITVRVFGRDSRAGVVGGLAAGFSNLVLIGIPFMLGVYGQEGFEILSLLVSVHLPGMTAASILLFALLGSKAGERPGWLDMTRDFARTLLSNPLIIGILAGLSWRVTGLSMPALPERLIDALADVAGPVALFAMGLSLRRYGISGNVRPALVVAALKLFLMPAAALVFAKLFGLPPLTAKVAVAAAALPSGVNPYLIASQFRTGQALASNAMTIATALAVVTTSFWLIVAQWAFA